MKPQLLSLVGPLLLAGCNVPAWGNLFVLVVTLALFCATLGLGRAAPARQSENASDTESQLS